MTSTTSLITTIKTLRLTITPYLPPPLVALLHKIDISPSFSAYDEPSYTILVTLLTLLLISKVLLPILSAIFQPRKLKSGASSLMTERELSSISRNSVLLTGPAGSGKTTLLSLLHNPQPPKPTAGNEGKGYALPLTVTSMKPNAVTYTHAKTNSKLTFDVIDLPSTLPTHLPQYIRRAKAIVIMMDGTSPKSIIGGSEILFNVITSKGKNGVNSIMVFANMKDKVGCKPLNRVKNQMNDEIERLRITQRTIPNSDSPDGVAEDEDDSDNNDFVIVKEDGTSKGFDVDVDCGVDVRFFRGTLMDWECVEGVKVFMEETVVY